jgi:hypothetical protein
MSAWWLGMAVVLVSLLLIELLTGGHRDEPQAAPPSSERAARKEADGEKAEEL